MAFKYTGVKFDDPDLKVDQAGNKIVSIPLEVHRRAIQAVSNRVLGSTAGTSILGPQFLFNLGAAGSAGLMGSMAVAVVRNGVWSTVAVQNNMFMPQGVQGTGTVAKYLVASEDGTSGTVKGPGNVIVRADYTTEALAAAAAKLPDLPDGAVALGYVTLVTDEKLTFDNAAGFPVGTGGTCGTGTFVNLICMPYDK